MVHNRKHLCSSMPFIIVIAIHLCSLLVIVHPTSKLTLPIPHKRMVNIVRTRQNSIGGSPKAAEVGEIDTKAPFESVRAAVSLFGETSSDKAKPVFTKKPKSQIEVRGVLDKEAQFHLALNELNKLKEQLRGVESSQVETLPKLDKAKKTLEELRAKLKLINESKQSIIEASDALLNNKTNMLEQVVHDSEKHGAKLKRDEYKVAIVELDAAKQVLSNIRREYDATLEAKLRALKKSQQAELATDAHQERVEELSKQVTAMREALANVKASSIEAVLEHEKLLAKKDEEFQSSKVVKAELKQKLLALEEEHIQLIGDNLDLKLVEADAEITSLQEEVKIARKTFLEAQKATGFDLEISKGSLKQVEEEKISLQNYLEFLKHELEHVGKELSEQKQKQDETEVLANKIRAEIEDKKNELEASLVNKTSATNASNDMNLSLEQFTEETQRAKQEAEEMTKRTKEQLQLVMITREMITKMEDKLPDLLKNVEQAKASETIAQQEIEVISDKSDVDDTSTESNVNNKIKLSNEEYNSLMEKVNESEKLAEVKVAAAKASVEALVANQQEAAKKYEAYSKVVEELKMAEEEALKAAEMAEAATNALEIELHRIHQQEEIYKITEVN